MEEAGPQLTHRGWQGNGRCRWRHDSTGIASSLSEHLHGSHAKTDYLCTCTAGLRDHFSARRKRPHGLHVWKQRQSVRNDLQTTSNGRLLVKLTAAHAISKLVVGHVVNAVRGVILNTGKYRGLVLVLGCSPHGAVGVGVAWVSRSLVAGLNRVLQHTDDALVNRVRTGPAITSNLSECAQKSHATAGRL